MSDSLTELLDRLNWARGEVKVLEGEIAKWMGGSIRVYSVPDKAPGYTAIMLYISEALPLSVRARSGTVANEIRSCLDGLATILAERNGQVSAYFPVADDENAFETGRRFRARLAKFQIKDRDALLAFRPFAQGSDGEPGNVLLYGLHHADVRRKHHKLGSKSVQSQMAFGDGILGTIIHYAPKLKAPGTTKVAAVSHSTTLSLNFEPSIEYTEPNVLRGRPLVKTLYDFADIAETIIRAFL